jgi:hypothetical protein
LIFKLAHAPKSPPNRARSVRIHGLEKEKQGYFQNGAFLFLQKLQRIPFANAK